MNTTDVQQEKHVVITNENNRAYFPFKEGERVQSVLLENKVTCEVKVVESDEAITSEEEKVDNVDVGLIKTHCLIVETSEETTVTVLTIK